MKPCNYVCRTPQAYTQVPFLSLNSRVCCSKCPFLRLFVSKHSMMCVCVCVSFQLSDVRVKCRTYNSQTSKTGSTSLYQLCGHSLCSWYCLAYCLASLRRDTQVFWVPIFLGGERFFRSGVWKGKMFFLPETNSLPFTP